MAVRKDYVQIEVEINGKKAGQELERLEKVAAKLKKELDGLEPGTDAFNKKALEIQQVGSQMDEVKKRTRGVASAMTSLLPALNPIAIIGGLAGIAKGLFDFGKASLEVYQNQKAADEQLKASLNSTAEVAGRNFEQLKQQAKELEGVTLFDDTDTQKAQAFLLTFTNIRKEVFDDSIPLIQDYATVVSEVTGESVNLRKATEQIGSALDNPIKGMGNLARAGIHFTDQQRNLIKSLQNSGKTAEAQRVILQRLELQFGGSAQAAARAVGGGFEPLGIAVTNLQEKFGELIESYQEAGKKKSKVLIPFLTKTIAFAQRFVETLLSGTKATGQYSGAINGIILAFKTLATPIKVVTQISIFLLNNVLRPVVGFIFDKAIFAFQFLAEKISNIIRVAQNIPIIGGFVRALASSFKFLINLIENTSATFSGLKAAAVQTVENVKAAFQSLITSVQIAAKELSLAMSIRPETRERLKEEIRQLEKLKETAKSSGENNRRSLRRSSQCSDYKSPRSCGSRRNRCGNCQCTKIARGKSRIGKNKPFKHKRTHSKFALRNKNLPMNAKSSSPKISD